MLAEASEKCVQEETEDNQDVRCGNSGNGQDTMKVIIRQRSLSAHSERIKGCHRLFPFHNLDILLIS